MNQLVQDNPNITKEEFLRTMRIEEESEIPCGCGNYYIDDLDVTALNYSFEPNAKKVVFDQILKIATLFAKYGVTDVHTHCINIDSKTRSVSVTQASVKY